MSQVDFYLLNAENPTARYPIVCRLIEKAYQQGHRIYIHTMHQQEAQTLDELLWNYRDDSFIPHHLYDGSHTSPIQIGFQVEPKDFNDILINLDLEIPSFYHHFKRILEIVPTDETWRVKLREHFRFYREKNFEIKTHQL